MFGKTIKFAVINPVLVFGKARNNPALAPGDNVVEHILKHRDDYKKFIESKTGKELYDIEEKVYAINRAQHGEDLQYYPELGMDSGLITLYAYGEINPNCLDEVESKFSEYDYYAPEILETHNDLFFVERPDLIAKWKSFKATLKQA
jgi:hypothetical protein